MAHSSDIILGTQADCKDDQGRGVVQSPPLVHGSDKAQATVHARPKARGGVVLQLLKPDAANKAGVTWGGQL